MRTSTAPASPFSSVLCAVDFSAHAGAALRYAAAVARRCRSRLTVLYVNDPLLVSAAAAAFNNATIGAASRVELERFVSATLSPRAIGTIKPRCTTALGKPVHEILRAVQQEGHSTVVVGTKGLNAAKRLFLGSTTAGLLREAKVPVLAVPPVDALEKRAITVTPSWPGKRIVAAIELGPHAAGDVSRAAAIAHAFDAQLLLLHVIGVPAVPPWLSADVDAIVRTNCLDAEASLEALRGEAAGVRTSVVVRVGNPSEQIAAVADDHHAGLIVMGLRGRDGLFGEHAGSFAYQVLCNGVAPVIALPDLRGAGRTRA